MLLNPVSNYLMFPGFMVYSLIRKLNINKPTWSHPSHGKPGYMIYVKSILKRGGDGLGDEGGGIDDNKFDIATWQLFSFYETIPM